MNAGDIANRLKAEADLVAPYLLPDGKRVGREWKTGSLAGEPGQSLGVCVAGNKAGVWSDFATGESGDLLDLWMQVKGCSLSDAMKEAMDYLGIQDDTSKLFKKKDWSKPVRPKCKKICSEKNTPVFDYLVKTRKLTKETIDLFKVADGGDSIVFPFLRDDKTVMIKSLKLERKNGKKDIKPTSANQEPCLFGWQAVDSQSRSVILVEGEIDCMSVKQMGHNCLSVPFGGGKGQNWIENEYDRINKFDTIYLCMDNDEAGETARQEIVERLGRHRCKILSLGKYKDANEALVAGFDIFDLQKAIGEAKNCDPEELRQLSEFHNDIMEEFFPKNDKLPGVVLPWRKTQDKVRLRPGEISVWAGINGHGKSLILSQIMADCVSQGDRVCIASMEMSPADTGHKLYMQIGGNNRPSKDYSKKIQQFVHDSIWIFNLYGTAKADRIISVFEYAKHRYGVKHFVVDSLAKCGIAEDDYNTQKAFIDRLMEFSGKYKVHTHVVIHIRKKGDETQMPNKMDVKGSGGLVDMVDNLFVVFRNKLKEYAMAGNDEKKIEKYKDQGDAYLSILKQRKTGQEPRYALWFHENSGQFVERDGTPPKQYLFND